VLKIDDSKTVLSTNNQDSVSKKHKLFKVFT